MTMFRSIASSTAASGKKSRCAFNCVGERRRISLLVLSGQAYDDRSVSCRTRRTNCTVLPSMSVLRSGLACWTQKLPVSVSHAPQHQRLEKRTFRSWFGRGDTYDDVIADDDEGFRYLRSERGEGEEPYHYSQYLGLDATDLSSSRPIPNKIGRLFPVSVCSIKGYRKDMEDDFFVEHDFCAVFDGHGGSKVSEYLRQHLYTEVQAALPSSLYPVTLSEANHVDARYGATVVNNLTLEAPSTNPTFPTIEDYHDALIRALDKLDRDVLRIVHWQEQGSTALAVWLHESPLAPPEGVYEDTRLVSCPPVVRTLVTANLGDSRVVLSRHGVAVELSQDHKPDVPKERDRIVRAGGTVDWVGELDRHGNPIPGLGLYRVNGIFALSRSLGDQTGRPAISARPELSLVPLEGADEFLILATDGLWDVMSSEDAVAFVHMVEETMEETERDEIVSLLVQEALRRGSDDNITVILVWLNARYLGTS